MIDTKEIGGRIRQLRQQNGLTQGEFADILAVSFQAVSNWERGITPPDLENLVRIADHWGILVDDLLRQRQEDLYLGIDGGGTKTEFAVVSPEGYALKRLVKGGCNPNDIGFSGMWTALSQGIEEILAQYPSVKAGFCGIAGITTGTNAEKLSVSLQKRFPQVAFQIKSDAFNLLAMDDRADMAVISGTGSVVFVRKGEDYARLGGWGYLLDNAGSAYDMGRMAIQHALGEEDMRQAPSLLRQLVCRQLQTQTVWEGLHRIYDGGKPYIASFARVVFDAHEKGDPAALQIIDSACKALAQLLNAGVRLHDAKAVAIASGGLFQHFPQIMIPGVGKYSDVTLIANDLTPVYGACRRAVTLGGGSLGENFFENFQKTYGGAL